MTKTLSQIKADTRKEWSNLIYEDEDGNIEHVDESKSGLLARLDSLIDATFLAIKEGVVPDIGYFDDDGGIIETERIGWNTCRAEVLRNFDAMEGNEKSV